MGASKSKSRHISLDLYKDLWVLTSQGVNESWMTVHLPPVRIIPKSDLATLVKTIRLLLKEPIPHEIPVSDDELGLKARAVGAKSWPAYNRSARVFDLSFGPSALSIEEWRREGYGFVAADPVWKIRCRASELEATLTKLLRRVSDPQ